MAKTTPRYKKMEFSKKLAVLNTVLYVLVLFFCLGMWVIKNGYPETILSTSTAQYALTLSVYMAKAGVENYKKIDNTEVDTNV